MAEQQKTQQTTSRTGPRSRPKTSRSTRTRPPKRPTGIGVRTSQQHTNSDKEKLSIPTVSQVLSQAPPSEDQPQAIKELQAKVVRMELLMEISRLFSATLDFDKLMNTIFEKVLLVLEAEAGSFWMPDTKSQEIVCRIAEGPAKKEVIGLRLKEGTGIVGWVIDNKQKTVIFDASKDERFSSKVDEKTKFVTKSMLCVPLVVENECVGAIQVINKKTENGQFSPTDLTTLESLANSGAIAIKNARLYQSEQRIKELNTLLNISQELTSTLDLDRVLLSVVNLGSQVIDYKRAVIGLLGEREQVILAAESRQAAPDLSTPENVQLKKILDYVMASGNSLYLNRYNKNAPPKGIPDLVIEYMNEFQLHSLSVIILSDSEGKLGMLSMEGTKPTLVGDQSQYIINMLVNQATVAIRNAQLYQNIPSTGIGGRFKVGAKAGKKNFTRIAKVATIALFALLATLLLPIPASVITDVEIVPEHKTQVTTRSSGVVKKVLFTEGELVQNGQPLLELDSSLLDLEKAKLEKDQLIALSELRLEESEGNAQTAHMKRLELEKIQHQLKSIEQKLSHTRILATKTGRILTSKPKELVDKQVTEGEVIAEISVSDKKSAHLLIEEADILKINPGDMASLTLQVFPGVVLEGELQFISHTKTENEEQEEEYYIGHVTSKQLNEFPAVKFGMTGAAKIHLGNQTLYQLYMKPEIDRFLAQFKLWLSI